MARLERMLALLVCALIFELVSPLVRAQEACKPQQYPLGAGTPLKYEFVDLGLENHEGRRQAAHVAFYFCPSASDASGWKTVAYYCWADRVAECFNTALTAMPSVLWSGGALPGYNLATANLIWADDLFKTTKVAQHRPPRPATPAYVTAGTTTYNVVNGALSSIAGTTQRGVACNCAQPVRVGSGLYCTFAGAPRASVVALCRAP